MTTNRGKHIRIIPRLDIKGPNIVKGIFTEGLRIIGDPKTLTYKYYNDGADEILLMDVVASLYQRSFDFELLKSVSDKIFVPITVGGGIRSVNDINNALRAGADKVAINTHAIRNPKFLKEAAKKFGSQCIVLSVEAKKRSDGTWEAYTDGGREHTGINAINWIRQAIKFGIGEIVITSIDKDGSRKGYDLELVKAVTDFANVPVIAHGGASTKESVAKAIKTADADAVALATPLHYGNFNIKELKTFLRKKGFNVRI